MVRAQWSGIVAIATLLAGTSGAAFGACQGGTPNGIVQPPEQCDDGNQSNTDGCLNDCTVAFCGDGFVRAGVEDCDGQACCTPTCTFADSTVDCRAAADVCDVDEFCTGTAADCPADAKQPAGTTCRAAADDCDLDDTCTGTSAACPANGFKSNTTVCRAAASVCDIAETCTGTSAACPPDAMHPAGFVCRPAAGGCDREEFCDAGGNCPPDLLKIAGQPCRAAAGACDDVDLCDGTSVDCPDGKKSSTVVCHTSTGPCDLDEMCTGTSNACPASTAPAGTSCDDGNPCTDGDVCNNIGACVGQSCVDDHNSCTTDSCEVTGCTHVPVTNGMACDDGDPCTIMDQCTDGVCAGQLTSADSDGDGYCDFQEDQAGCDPNDDNEIPLQKTTFEGRPRGRAGILLTYAAPTDHNVERDKDPSCKTAGHCNRFGNCNLTTHKCKENTATTCMTDPDCGVFGPRGFCDAGKIADPCVANADCDGTAGTCRVVVNFAGVSGLMFESATLNHRTALTGFTPAHAGCSRKVDVTLDPDIRVNRLRLRATSDIGRDRDVFNYR